MRADVYTCTRRALRHEDNEDRAVVGTEVLGSTRGGIDHRRLDAPIVLAVLDGLGGHPAGDVASELAARVIAEATPPPDEGGAATLLRSADQHLQDAMRDEPARYGMGATAALLSLNGGDAVVANVGDATAWKLTDDGLQQLSIADRAPGSPASVLQCLGALDHGVDPHVRRIDVAPGDRLLLASDGLTDVVPQEVIAETLRGDAGRATADLLAMVETARLPDDVTIVVVDVIEV